MKRYLTFSAAFRIIAAGMLIYALRRNPYSFYTILRWVTCGAAAYTAYVAFESKQPPWTFLMAVVALLFNPFFPVGLDRSTWAVVDVVTGIVMLISIFFVREEN
jgi:hypothetical protein